MSKKGEICVNTLKKDWNPSKGLRHVLMVRKSCNTNLSVSDIFHSSSKTIKCLLIAPNPESALNEEAGRLLLEKYEDYAKHAKLMTQIHAKKLSLSNSDCSSTETSNDKSSLSTSTSSAPSEESESKKPKLSQKEASPTPPNSTSNSSPSPSEKPSNSASNSTSNPAIKEQGPKKKATEKKKSLKRL